MNHQESFSRIDEDTINSATSVEDIVRALARRGCLDLTSSINLSACSENPCAGGGFCDVYRGKLNDGTKIAIKSLRIYDGPDADSQRRKILKHAARELYHWSKLQHPNVLRLMGLTMFRDRIAMVSEWMDNGSLMSFLLLNPDVDRIPLCIDVCAGLCYIHEHEMIHGDLKAANVMVSSQGVAMIADFGNAQLKDLTLKFSNTKGFNISLRWTAPELLSGDESLPPTKEADVYACGMTMLEVLTGEVPFQKKRDTEVLRLVLQMQHPSRPEIDIDDDVWQVLDACWDWRPAERPSIEIVKDCMQALNPGYDPRARGWDQKSTHSLPVDLQDRGSELLSLGIAAKQRFETLGKLADIDEAILYLGQTVQLTPDGDINKPTRLYWLAISHGLRFEHQDELADIGQAIKYHNQAVKLTPNDNPRLPARLFWLGMSHYLRFKFHGELADINQAISYYNQAVQLTPDKAANKPAQLYWLGKSHYLRFEDLHELVDIDMAIDYLTQAMQLTSDDNADKPDRLDWLGRSHYLRFRHCGEIEDINKAIIYHKQAVYLTHDDDADQPDRLHRLGRSHYLRFEEAGELSDIDQAINCHNLAVQLTPDDSAEKPDRLHWLGRSHNLRFEHQGELVDIEQAISCHSQAVQLTPDDDPFKTNLLHWLTESRSHLSEHVGNPSDIELEISPELQTLRLTPGNPEARNQGSVDES